MTQPTQWTTQQFTTNGGVLGLDRSAMSRVVARSTVQSTGDGPHGGHAPGSLGGDTTWADVSPNLKTMIDQRVHWKNDYGVPVLVQANIQRARRTFHISAPNYAFIRERYTTRVGNDLMGYVTAPTPDPTNIWDTETGGGIDVGWDGTYPKYAQWRYSQPESTLMLEPLLVGVGQSIDVRYRAALITPFRWWGKKAYAQESDFVANAEAFANTIILTSMPQPAE